MTRPVTALSALAAVLAALALVPFIEGCAPRPVEKEAVLAPSAKRSADGFLTYRVPAGWLDASTDAASKGLSVWLLRPDFRASISVDQVHLDPQAREMAMGDGGMLALARLSMQLTAGDAVPDVEREPEEIRVNGAQASRYDLRTPDGDLMRTVLVLTGERVYAVTALLPTQEPQEERQQVLTVQQAFVESLGW